MLVDRLQKELAERCRRNPSYSLRAFARHLEMDSSTLSALLRKKRPISARTAQRLITALGIVDPIEAERLLITTVEGKGLQSAPTYTELDLAAAEAIGSWEHFAILATLEVCGKRAEAKSLARRLKLPLGTVIECLSRLERLGLVRTSTRGGPWELTGKNFATPTNLPNPSLREAHRQTLAKAKESLDQHDLTRRDFSGITMAIDSEKLEEARVLIKEFRRKLSAFLEAGEKDSVYRLNIQLFPLTDEESA